MSGISAGVDETEQRLGRAIRRWRVDAGLSQDDVAERASISRSVVRAPARGTGSRLATLVRVLRAIGHEDALDIFTLTTAPTPLELLAAQRRAERGATDAPRVSRRR